MLNSLQACRALVAVMIVIGHANYSIFAKSKYFDCLPCGTCINFYAAGVDFFFVLSGFLIAYAHTDDIGKPCALGGYLWKRYSRVLPLYWILLAAVLPVFFLVPEFGKGFERDVDAILASLFLLPHPDGHYIIVVAWTLPFEMLFYALFAMLVIDRRFGYVVFAAWTAGILAHQWFDTFPASFVFNNMHLRFVAGMVVCMIFQNYRIPWPRVLAFAGVALFFGVGMIEVLYGLSSLGYIAGYTLASAMMVGGFAEADRSGLIEPPRFLVYLGNATYSIYLVHFTVLSVIAKMVKYLQLDAHVPMWPLFLLHVAGGVGAGCLSYRFLEKPLHDWSKRFFRARPAEKPVVEFVPVPDLRQAA